LLQHIADQKMLLQLMNQGDPTQTSEENVQIFESHLVFLAIYLLLIAKEIRLLIGPKPYKHTKRTIWLIVLIPNL
jgi:hypothetical protein